MSFYLSGNATANVVIRIKQVSANRRVTFECGGHEVVALEGDTCTVSVPIVNADEPVSLKAALRRIKKELE